MNMWLGKLGNWNENKDRTLRPIAKRKLSIVVVVIFVYSVSCGLVIIAAG
jgi:hypothetical protein